MQKENPVIKNYIYLSEKRILDEKFDVKKNKFNTIIKIKSKINNKQNCSNPYITRALEK